MYKRFFNVGTKTVKDKVIDYLSGLFVTERGKRNIERMTEQVKDSNYENLQHFISNSPWDTKGLIIKNSQNVSKKLVGYGLIGCTVDEKANLKKGTKSAGVARQYAGTVGKVENCQVGVYLSLCAGKYASLTNYKLYLPKEWTDDKKRCLEAGIPEDKIVFKTKPQLALEMIKEHISNGVHFDYINGDGLYGNGYEFSKGLEQLGIKYVLDVHSNHDIYLKKPNISVPQKTANKRGRDPKLLKADIESVSISGYVETLKSENFQRIRIRKTTKGWLEAYIHIAKVWVWDKQNNDTEAIEQTLIVRLPVQKKVRPKYSLSNIEFEEQNIEMLAFMQAQRFWIERCFRDNSHDLGMSDYQVRTYKGFNNHMGLTCLAMEFVLQQRLKNIELIPLLSYNDIRILLADFIMSRGKNFNLRFDQLIKRHEQRAVDISKHYKFSDLPK
jgi:SRSO17 transposase